MSDDQEDTSPQERAEQGAIRELLNTVELGLDAKQFLHSNMGRYVANRAQEEMFAASKELTTVDAHDASAVVVLQTRYKVAAEAISWLAQAIQAGTAAEEALSSGERTD